MRSKTAGTPARLLIGRVAASTIGMLWLFCTLLASCRAPAPPHVAVGRWIADDHTLSIYEDGTAAVDGAAAHWKHIDDATVRIEHRLGDIDMISEFSVVGTGVPPEVNPIEAAQKAPATNKSNKKQKYSPYGRTIPAPDWVKNTSTMLELGIRSEPSPLARKIEFAAQNNLEVGHLRIGNYHVMFVRTMP